jgi:hypothetical protein
MVASAPSNTVHNASLGFRAELDFPFCFFCAQHFPSTSARLGQGRIALAIAVPIRPRTRACRGLLLAAVAVESNRQQRIR